MTERALPLVSVLVAALGCSVLVNTDYTGGKEPAHSNVAGHSGAALGGSSGSQSVSGGSLGESGANEGGEADAPGEGGMANDVGMAGGSSGAGGLGADGIGGGAGEPQGGNGADEGVGGSGGGLSGSAGAMVIGGSTGTTAGSGGAAPAGAGMGGSAGTTSGAAGSSGAGGMTCSADLTSDPMHCGTCTNACATNSACISSRCVSSPCDGICPTWTTPTDEAAGPKVENFMSAADLCVEVTSYTPAEGYLPAFNCWNTGTRVIEVNGMQMTCDSQNYPLAVATRKGGYCVHATAGTFDYAGFVMPLTADCCKASQ